MLFRAIPFFAVVIAGAAATAQNSASDSAGWRAEAAKFGCNVNPNSNQDIRCCLALLDSRGLTGDAAPAGELEARLLSVLASRGESGQPRICPTPTGFPPWYDWPDSLRRPPRVGEPDPRRFEIALTLGTLLNQPAYRLPTGGGSYQDFPLVSGSRGMADLRFSWLLYPGLRGDSQSPGQLAFYAGYQGGNSHIDRVINSGGGINTAFEGSFAQRRPYIGLAYILPLVAAASSSSLPPTELMFGANIGYSSVRLSDDAGPFERKENGWDYGTEFGLNFQMRQGWMLSPSLSANFDTPGLDNPQYRFNLGLRHRF